MALSSLYFSCKKEAPQEPPHEVGVQLSVEDASCTEAWLKVSLLDASQPRTVALLKDGQRVLTAQMTTADSVFVVEGLLPRHTYSYVAQRLRDTSVIDVSSPVQARTMDTTSHDISWQQVEAFGDGNSSTLWDVAIINDTLAYAVGEIYLRDSTGQFDPSAYNAARWNGRGWGLMRIAVPICGSSSTGSFPLYTVFAFGANDIWFSGGGDMEHWDGVSFHRDCSMNPLISGRISKLWGTSSSNLFAVGDYGTIIHYNGNSWQRIESGTTVPLKDVWGGGNRIAGENIVLMTGSDNFTLSERKILRLKQQGGVDSLVWGTVFLRPQSVWFDENDVFVCGDRLFRLWQDKTWRPLATPSIFLERVRGTARNDLIIVGDFGVVLHYNGLSVHQYPDVSLSSGIYQSVAVGSNTIIAVGWSGSQAAVLVGRR